MSFKKKLIKYSEHLYTFHPGKLTHLLYLAFSHTHTIYFFFFAEPFESKLHINTFALNTEE